MFGYPTGIDILSSYLKGTNPSFEMGTIKKSHDLEGEQTVMGAIATGLELVVPA